jgi:hypothetical protein
MMSGSLFTEPTRSARGAAGSEDCGRALEAADAVELAGELSDSGVALLRQHGEPAQGAGHDWWLT